MKFLKILVLAICFVAIAAGTCYVVVHGVPSLTSDSPAGRDKADPSNKKPTATPSPLPTGSVILKETDPVSVTSIPNVEISNLAAGALASVVQIAADVTDTDMWGRIVKGTSEGSGIVLDQDEDTLYIATNQHVISNATAIRVTFSDGTAVDATLRGSDEAGDLAILTIPLSSLSDTTEASYRVASLGVDTPIKVGDMVVAVGNALGYGTSVTVGYVSALDRGVSSERGELSMIQTDAAINPGNSGGALINLKGEVIGINSMKYTESYGKIEGMGFAIPITQALPILNELKQQKSFPSEESGYLGVHIATVTNEMVNNFGWPKGVYIKALVENGAAQAAGLLPGDIILSVNGIRVLDTSQLSARVSAYQAGTEVTLVISRENGDGDNTRSEITLNVTLMDRGGMPD